MDLVLGIFIGSVITYFVVIGTKKNDYMDGFTAGEKAMYEKVIELLDGDKKA